MFTHVSYRVCLILPEDGWFKPKQVGERIPYEIIQHMFIKCLCVEVECCE